MSASLQPELLLGDILTYVDQAEKLLAEKNVEALTTLDTTVDVLCERLASLSVEHAKEYAPEIDHLVERMKTLTTRMQQARDKVGDDMNALTSHHRAARAYLSTPES
jgi:hypothetical protein